MQNQGAVGSCGMPPKTSQSSNHNYLYYPCLPTASNTPAVANVQSISGTDSPIPTLHNHKTPRAFGMGCGAYEDDLGAHHQEAHGIHYGVLVKHHRELS